MEEQEIKAGNKLIAEFMGYIHYHPGVDIEYEYETKREEVFSKVPIEVVHYSDDEEISFKDESFRDYLTDLEYHKNWNELMPVVFKITRETNYMIFFWSNVCHVQHLDFFTRKYNRETIPDEKNYIAEFYSETSEKVIDAIYQAVVNFLHYNKKT